MKHFVAAFAGVTALMSGGAAGAAISIGFANGNAVYAGPAPTYDFDITTPIFSGGGVVSPPSASGSYAQPLGGTGKYFSVGLSASPSADITIGSAAGIASLSFIWGSMDNYNRIEILDASNTVLFVHNGAGNGSWTDQQQNPIATLTFTGGDRYSARTLRMTSNTNAFEIDNIAIAAVPEPATWAVLVIGFGALGGAMRRRAKAALASSRGLIFAS